ncbi:MAG: DNA-processing protein DprA [Bacteroidetes bacterium]|nr:DNA-processing protein DprA [Bacteroidota bacterium]
MYPDIIYKIALTFVPNIGPVQAKILLQHCEAEEIFHAKKSYLEKIEGIGPVRAQSIKKFNGFKRAEEELRFIEKFNIQPLFLTDERYPRRLLNCYDSPTLLYYKGQADLNASRIVSVIGTRSNTEYARQVTESLIQELASCQVTIVSGLAFGVDAIAHRAALKHTLPTVGVLAHGLGHIYPAEHASMARDMIAAGGGLLTEFSSQLKPDKHHFPTRNRVVAGMTDATIVIETATKGGSMITAELANNYNRDVFAFPGKISDLKSAGCNQLIKNNKAVLVAAVSDIPETMGWREKKSKKTAGAQKQLFIELNPHEKTITRLLEGRDSVHIDELNALSSLSSSAVAAAILSLELQNVVLSLPGKLYRLA